MIREHEATRENEGEMGEKLGSDIMVMSVQTWKRIKSVLEEADRRHWFQMRGPINVVHCDMSDDELENLEDEGQDQ